MNDSVSSEAVERYMPVIAQEARRFAKLEVPLAEYDDLVQVGLVRTWKDLLRQGWTSKVSIESAMKDELRRVGVDPGLGVSMEPVHPDLADDLGKFDGGS